QLMGEPGDFWYEGKEKLYLYKSSSFSGQVIIGNIPMDQLDAFEHVLAQVRIVQDANSKWNCQSWCIDALELLRARGWVFPGINE
ncbi:hypothetical protein PUNSTDRAFT_15777, partial [Punctularia strigosozonata HHB-11173 SS5]|uniref:uncharacterized protein n=1 Tax=Punctularia strigosozonata (strain HHB-11173) TaxID=741275 RepID=UPI000441733A